MQGNYGFLIIFLGVTAHNDAFYVTSVWCAMTWKWAFLLFIYARKYFKEIISEHYTDPEKNYERF